MIFHALRIPQKLITDDFLKSRIKIDTSILFICVYLKPEDQYKLSKASLWRTFSLIYNIEINAVELLKFINCLIFIFFLYKGPQTKKAKSDLPKMDVQEEDDDDDDDDDDSDEDENDEDDIDMSDDEEDDDNDDDSDW